MSATSHEPAAVLHGGLVAAADALASRSVTSAQLVDAVLDAIDSSQSELNAFRLVRHDAARREAAEADRRLDAGERLPLLGVPVAVKDDTETAGDDMRFGSPEDVGLDAVDAPVVERLRAAGAVVVGKATTCEFGQWPFTSGAFGHTRNPWDPAHTPGGSSGGSAAAVAAGLVPAAVGSDGAGSVRIPAAWTHLVGIKPPSGLVPYREGALGFHDLTVHGPLARTVGDAAVLLDVLADTGDRFRRAAGTETGSLPRSTGGSLPRSTPRPLAVGIALTPAFAGPGSGQDVEVVRAVRRMADVLAGLGHDVRGVEPFGGLAGRALGAALGTTFLARSLPGVHAWSRRVDDPAGLDPRTRENARAGGAVPVAVAGAATGARASLRARVDRALRGVDVLLTPTTATLPPLVRASEGLSGWRTDRQMAAACPYGWPWNVLGWPAVSVPAGRAAGGLPVGAQLLGRGDDLDRLVSLAAQLEAVQGWSTAWPPGWGPD